jgi:hypothetical protein
MTDHRAHEAFDRANARREATPKDSQYSTFYSGFFDGWYARESAATMRHPTDIEIIDDMIAAAQARAERSHDQSLKLLLESRGRERLIAAQKIALESQGKNPEDAPLYRRIIMQRNEIRRLTAENEKLSEQSANIAYLLDRRADKEAPNAAEALRFKGKIIRDGTTLPENMLGATAPTPAEGTTSV